MVQGENEMSDSRSNPSSPSATRAIVAVLLGTMLLAGCEGERSCIERVLQEDLTAGSHDDPAKVVASMKAISMTSCPADFREVYFDHIRAWQLKRDVTAALDGITPPEGFFDGAIKLLGVAALAAKDQDASQQISSTFRNVERLAARYGAQLASK